MQASEEPVVGVCTESSHYSLCMHHVACAICVAKTSPLTSSQYYMNHKVIVLQESRRLFSDSFCDLEGHDLIHH